MANDNLYMGSLFGDEELNLENPLMGKRVCMTGSFSMVTRDMNAKLRALGVTDITRIAEDKVFKAEETVPPAKELTDFFVVGTNPHEATLLRWELNAHDGYCARKITEEKLYQLMNGIFSDADAMPNNISKKLDLDFSYYDWKAPIINGKEFVSRTSSPVNYADPVKPNPFIGKEIYIPEIDGVNMNALRQIVGNIGGYANMYYDSNTYAIMLGDETFAKWKTGVKDKTILSIEEDYNKSDNKFFNVCFTTLAEFLNWLNERVERFGDNVTKDLIGRLYL